jgi:hypothetical protein
MPHLHDLATTIGNSAVIGILSSLAAGLAALALTFGTAKVKRQDLPKDFPNDPEARLAKYSLAFSQLLEAGKDEAAVQDLANSMKRQPAPHLCLSALASYLHKQAGRTRVK